MFSVLTISLISQAQPGYTLPQLPPGASLSAGFIMTRVLYPLANFLIVAGIALAIITIVVAGIMYLKAGSDTEAKSAKGWFRNGVIGAFIILAVGVIILTIYNIVVTGTFFGGGTGGGGVGSPCAITAQCQPGLTCRIPPGTTSGFCLP